MNKLKLTCMLLVWQSVNTSFSLLAQEKITLSECYSLARQNYPAIKKMELIAKTKEFNVENANRRYLPQVSFSGQATYQSQTISFPDALGTLPNVALPTISKDQYKVVGEVNQQLYDGGNLRYQKELIKANTELQQQNIEVSLYAIKDRINSIYFSVLLMDAQLGQNELNKSNLQTQLQKAEAALKNGLAYNSNVDELNAEITNIDMVSAEYKANRSAFLKMLSIFIGKELSAATQFETPQEPQTATTTINRLEIKTYDLQKSIYNIQQNQLKADYLPKVSAFFQGAYGRPTLNIIDNKFGTWYYTGIRFNWSLGSLYLLPNQKKVFGINSQLADADKETFLLNTKLDVAQQDGQVKKYTDLIQQDNKVIKLRQSVKNSAANQLENGAITTHEYIQQANAENLAQQTLLLHKLQLLQAQYNQQFKSGN